MRNIPESVIQEANAQSTSSQWFVLIEIHHSYNGALSPIRLTDNPAGAIYNGNEYFYFPFNIDLPDSMDDGPVNGRISIGAGSEITRVIREIDSPATLKAIAVCVPDTNIIEPVSAFSLVMRNISGNKEVITAELIFEERFQNMVPCDEGSPYIFPGA